MEVVSGQHRLKIRLATVSYRTPSAVLVDLFDSICIAWAHCRAAYPQAELSVVVVDNSPDGEDATRLVSVMQYRLTDDISSVIHSGHGNVGYGAGLNRALLNAGSDISLAVNPDIVLEPDSLKQVVATFHRQPQAGLVTPTFLEDGQRTHLCKRLPSLAALILRRLPRPLLNRPLEALLARYEMRDQAADRAWWDPPLVSGAFMAFRSEVLQRLGGFDERYFLYFEDFDISVRAHRVTRLLYSPDIRVTHAAPLRKNWLHLLMLFRSAPRFWRQHGFRFVSVDEVPQVSAPALAPDYKSAGRRQTSGIRVPVVGWRNSTNPPDLLDNPPLAAQPESLSETAISLAPSARDLEPLR